MNPGLSIADVYGTPAQPSANAAPVGTVKAESTNFATLLVGMILLLVGLRVVYELAD